MQNIMQTFGLKYAGVSGEPYNLDELKEANVDAYKAGL